VGGRFFGGPAGNSPSQLCCRGGRRADPNDQKNLRHARRLRPGEQDLYGQCARNPRTTDTQQTSIFDYLRSEAGRHDSNFQLCIRSYLLGRTRLNVTNIPPYTGRLGDLPYQDPWWKVLLCVLALLLVIAAAIAEAVDGKGEISTTGGPGGEGSPTGDCCGLNPSGGGNSYVAAGLLAAAAVVAVAAAYSDVKDPFRRGQEATDPGVATTLTESLEAVIFYQDPVQCGNG